MDTQTLLRVALFDKCRTYTKARNVEAAGLYPYFKPISESGRYGGGDRRTAQDHDGV